MSMANMIQPHTCVAPRRYCGGFTLVELMVAMTIAMLILLALTGILVNTSRSNDEMARTNGIIENGRYAVQVLEDDLVHGGYWGGYIPRFDDLSATEVPGDAPTGVANPCEPPTAWDSNYVMNFIAEPVLSYDALPVGSLCVTPLPQRPGTDVLVVRRAESCVPGVGNCAPDVAGRPYIQPSSCEAEWNAGTVQAATANSITLASNASDVDDEYVGLVIRMASGVGAGQVRLIAAYDGASKIATVANPWDVVPDSTTTYSFEYMLGADSFPLHQRDCVGTGTPATLPVTAGLPADKRRMISNIYYISDIAHPERPGEVIPTLVRSELDFTGSLAHQPPVPLIEGVEVMRVELGIDNLSETGAAVDYTTAVDWADPDTRTIATNRGDGIPDQFVRCTATTPCTEAELANVVAAKLYLLIRSRDPSPGHVDTKSYCLGEPNDDGTCPVENEIAPANDNYKRHAFTTSVRLMNVSGRRETP